MEYHLKLLEAGGDVAGVVFFRATDDASAIATAQQHVGDRGAELRHMGRLVMRKSYSRSGGPAGKANR